MKVELTVTCKTEYSTVVEMDESMFQEYQQRLENRGINVEEDLFHDFININRDWQQDCFHEVEHFEVVEDE